MTVILWVKSRLQYMQDMCQSLYSPKGKQGKHSSLQRVTLGRVTRAALGAHGRDWMT
jgi:hypothetical protein